MAVVFLNACASFNINKVDHLIEQKQFQNAIVTIDQQLQKEIKPDQITLLQYKRATAYNQLAYVAMTEKKWDKAIRYFYLGNTEESDSGILDCYVQKIQEAQLQNNDEKALHLYREIVYHFPKTSRTDEFIYQFIQFTIDHNKDYVITFDAYKKLIKEYPDSRFIESSQLFIDKFIDKYAEAVVKHNSNAPQVIVDSLQSLQDYPTNHKQYIADLIAQQYLALGDSEIKKLEFYKAKEYYEKAVAVSPNQKKVVDKKIQNICQYYIMKGNEALAKREITDAIAQYQLTFTIIPNYEEAQRSIQYAKNRQQNISKAAEIKDIAMQYERLRKYPDAERQYKEAYRLDPLPEYAEKVSIMSNIAQIKKDPATFAMNIVKNYKNGILLRKVDAFMKSLEDLYGKSVKSSGWKTSYPRNVFKIEVRYDIYTPKDNLFLVWEINMKDKTVIPLNKMTEKVAGKE